MDHLPGVEREEDEGQERLRERRAQVFEDGPHVDLCRLVRPGSAQHLREGRQERERDDRQGAHGPDERPPRKDGPGRPEESEERRGDQASPEVVEDLPLADEREGVLPEPLLRRDHREEPEEDLPVAPHPAMLTARVGEDVGRVVVHQLHVGGERGPRVEPLEQVVREERVLRGATVDALPEGVDVVEPLSREDPFAEEVLVGVRDGRGVRVDAGMAGVDPREERARGARERHADPGLEDPVAFRHPPGDRVDERPVERMGQDPDEGRSRAPRETRIGVQGEDVPHGREDRHLPDPDAEGLVLGIAQEPVELLDLPALSLPPHEDPFLRVPEAVAVEEKEAVPRLGGVPAVQLLDSGDGGGQDRRVGAGRGRLRVAEIAQDRKVDVGVEVSEGLDLDVLEEMLDSLHAPEKRGDDDHRPRVLRNAVGEIQAGKPARRHPRRDDALHQERGELARGNQHEERCDGGHAGSPRGPGIRGRGEDAEARQQPDATEVHRGGVGEDETAKALARWRVPGHVDLETEPALADEVVPHVALPAVGDLPLGAPGTTMRTRTPDGTLSARTRALDRAQRHAHLRLAGRLGELLHGLPVAIAALEVHARVDRRRIPPQDLLHETDPLHVAAPVERRAEPEARDGVAGRGLVRGLPLVLGPHDVLGRRSRGDQRLFHPDVERGDALVVLAHPVPQLGDEGAVERIGKRSR